MTAKLNSETDNLIADKVWRDKAFNYNQLGGVETSVLDNGTGKGVRIAWVNTGSGLRFKVVLDRAMDIAEAFYKQRSLAWISHLGVTPPNPAASNGINWLQSFGVGLLTTCGLTHVGGPEKDEFGERGVHDRISDTAATIESIIQPNLLTNWQHFAKNENVAAIEPCSHQPFGQAEARKNGSLLFIQPCKTLSYTIGISIFEN